MLEILRESFAELNKKVKYCSFKSNDHLQEGLEGKTDVDLLVARKDADMLGVILMKLGFKRTLAGYGVRNHSREGFLGLDENTGKLVYLDVQYTLLFGENRVREYALDALAQLTLDTRIMHADYDVFISHPAIELETLLVRAALKFGFFERFRAILGMQHWSNSWEEQFCEIQIRRRASEAPDDQQPSWLGRELQIPRDVSNRYLVSVRRLVKSKLKFQRSHGALAGAATRFAMELNGILCWFNRTHFGQRLGFRRKSLVTGGVPIVLVGVDGSGKSTQRKLLAKKLGWKLDSCSVYLGAGDGPASWHRWFLIKLRNSVFKESTRGEGSFGKAGEEKSESVVKRLGKFAWAISLALEKRKKLRSIGRMSRSGVLVLVDRCPQTSTPGFNDGPLLAKLREHSSAPLRAIARFEWRIYQALLEELAPILVQLDLDHATSTERGETLSEPYFAARKQAVDGIAASYRGPVVLVDAKRESGEVSRQIIAGIWQYI